MKEYQDLFDLIEKYAGAVGIAERNLEEPDGRLWAGRYAQIALCLVQECTIDALLSQTEIWQEKLDEQLLRQEQKQATVIDGYLMLILPESPDKRLRAYIREVEMDTAVCRKHVVWPEPGARPEEKWRRIFKVTALGLPPTPALLRGAQMPPLNAAQEGIWQDISTMGAGRAARKALSGGAL